MIIKSSKYAAIIKKDDGYLVKQFVEKDGLSEELINGEDDEHNLKNAINCYNLWVRLGKIKSSK